MALADEIKTYLASPGSFAAGLALLRRAAQVPPGLERAAWNPYVPTWARHRLEEELAKVGSLLSASSVVPPRVEFQRDSKTDSPGVEPEDVRQLRARGRHLMKLRASKHAAIVLAAEEPDTPEREKRLFEMAREMMEEITPAVTKVYEALAEYEATGILTKVEQTEFEKGFRQARRINSLRASLSRFRKLHEREKDHAQRRYYARKILEKEAALAELEEITEEV